LKRLAVLLGFAALCAAAAGCFLDTETEQLRALVDELQRKNVELAVKRLELERELERLRAENRGLEEKPGAAGKKAP